MHRFHNVQKKHLYEVDYDKTKKKKKREVKNIQIYNSLKMVYGI